MTFPLEKQRKNRPNLWFEHIAQSRRVYKQQAGGITTKIPRLFDGSTSWFENDELIDDWLDLTVLEAET